MKRIKSEAEFTAEQLNKIAVLSDKTGLCPETVAILYGRGVCDKESIEAFIHPTESRFLSPYLMKGMKETVALITRAKEEGWAVVIYGDYDADGICATTIMRRVLADFGVEASVYVPERKNGYGLNEQSIDYIFEEYFPQLFITVDCGISNAKEVEYIKEQGAEVIVTDHHELPEVLPDCICVNPKLDDDYPYDNLCGAGVAFKVGCALNGKSAYSYLDFAAIATVADSVPLTGENRDIVAAGLKKMNKSPRANYAGFFNKDKAEEVTSQTVSFSIAPKINAAGRMGDAAAALTLFLATDEKTIYDYTVKLTAYNQERQKRCDELYLSAKAKLKEKGAFGRVIMLWDESWNTGFVGIVAARLSEEYSRPTLLFVRNGEYLKGSARSVDGVNIFEALKSCGDVIAEFGGHAQAAGVNVAVKNFDELERRLNSYLRENYDKSAFIPTCIVNGKLPSSPSYKFIRELALLEPYGVGNRRPAFTVDVGECDVKPLKAGSRHVSFKCNGLDMLFFSGAKYSRIMRCAAPKRLVFEYDVSTFRGREYIKGMVRDFIYSSSCCSYAGKDIALNCISLAAQSEIKAYRTDITLQEAQRLLDEREEYGTIFIACDEKTPLKYDLKGLEINLFAPLSDSLSAILLVAPDPDCDLSGYDKIVFLDEPTDIGIPSLEGKRVYVCTDIDGARTLKSVDGDRSKLVSVFRAVNANAKNLFGESAEEIASSNDLGAPYLQAAFALKVFEELGLISFVGGTVTVNRGKKTELNRSRLYNLVTSQGR